MDRREFLRTAGTVVAGIAANLLITDFAEACGGNKKTNIELLPGVSVDVDFTNARPGDVFESNGYKFKMIDRGTFEVVDPKGARKIYDAFAKNRCIGSDIILRERALKGPTS